MRKKSSRREWLENSYRQKAEEVNEILKDKMKNDTYVILNEDEWGAMLHDARYATKKGLFRVNPSKLTNEELDIMGEIFDIFLEEVPNYSYTGEELQNIKDKIGIDWSDKTDVNTFLMMYEYVQGVIGENNLSSYQLMNVINSRMEVGQTTGDIKDAIQKAVKNAKQDQGRILKLFSETGKYL
jgi:hypothetical protein